MFNLKSVLRNSTQRRRHNVRSLSTEQLEERRVLSGISLNSANGVLAITGSNLDDVAEVTDTDGRVEVALGNSEELHQKSFAASEIRRVVFRGYDGDDLFTNRSSIPTLAIGGAGDDQLFGGSGDDRLKGQEGDDVLSGGPGRDVIRGGSGEDFILAGAGADEAYGNVGDDQIYGDDGNDRIFGGDGDDRIHGDAGNDVLLGGNGNDIVHGNDGNDRLIGRAGDDDLSGGDGNDRANGGGGRDSLFGGDGRDRLFGKGGRDWIFGNGGRDKLYGGSGNDRLDGGEDFDRLYGEAGNDTLVVGRWVDGLTYNQNQSLPPDTEDRLDWGGPMEQTLRWNDTTESYRYETGRLRQSQLDRITQQARSDWQQVGLETAIIDGVNLRVADLHDRALGWTVTESDGTETVFIDDDASGQTWFVDNSPGSNSEFESFQGLLIADEDAAAFEKVDLLTVVTHELGHVAGLRDGSDMNVMSAYLAPGVRLEATTELVSMASESVSNPGIQPMDFGFGAGSPMARAIQGHADQVAASGSTGLGISNHSDILGPGLQQVLDTYNPFSNPEVLPFVQDTFNGLLQDPGFAQGLSGAGLMGVPNVLGGGISLNAMNSSVAGALDLVQNDWNTLAHGTMGSQFMQQMMGSSILGSINDYGVGGSNFHANAVIPTNMFVEPINTATLGGFSNNLFDAYDLLSGSVVDALYGPGFGTGFGSGTSGGFFSGPSGPTIDDGFGIYNSVVDSIFGSSLDGGGSFYGNIYGDLIDSIFGTPAGTTSSGTASGNVVGNAIDDLYNDVVDSLFGALGGSTTGSSSTGSSSSVYDDLFDSLFGNSSSGGGSQGTYTTLG